MKAALTGLILVLTCVSLMAGISPFIHLGTGNFAGKMASHASGDTIMLVLRENDAIKLRYSHDGGASWYVHSALLPPLEADQIGAPTLSCTPEAFILNAGKYFTSSLDGGQSWQANPTFWRGSFDYSPYLEQRNGIIKLFNLNLPYPEDRQQEFTIPGTNEFMAPQIFNGTQQNSNGGNSYFRGTDEIQGPVWLNSNLLIKQVGGGTNNGWPLFHGPVVISGEVQSVPAAYPFDSIFQGGLIENAPQQAFPDPVLARQNGMIVGPSNYDPDRIVKITVNGNGYTGWIGDISIPRRVFADVWADYPEHPFAIDTPADFRNNFCIRDTVWTILNGGSSANRTMFVNSKLWIEGEFGGHQTWCSADTMMIIGDILLSGTPAGTDPSDNTSSSVKLMSEQSILLKYGYKDPLDSLRIHPLCKADNDPINIYASLYALGYGYGNSQKDGVFSFEYQHPHGSIPAMYINDPDEGSFVINWIDLHRNHWPQSDNHPWPANLDYPWYNPLWPEAEPYLERGTVQLWGSVVQKRQGFLHRSYYDPEWPNLGIWNPDLDFCGGSSAPNPQVIQLLSDPPTSVTLQTRNFPGATGSGIGYKRDYRADLRNSLSFGADESGGYVWNYGIDLCERVTSPEGTLLPSYYRKPQYRLTKGKSFARKGDFALYATNDLLLSAVNDFVTDISLATQGDGIIRGLALGAENKPWVYQLAQQDSSFVMKLKELSPNNADPVSQYSFPVSTMLNDLTVLPSGRVVMAKYESSGYISLWELNDAQEAVHIEDWQLEVEANQPPIQVNSSSRLYMLPSADGKLEVLLWICPAGGTQYQAGQVFYAQASYPVSLEDPLVPSVPSAKLSAYPNPVRGELSISVKAASQLNHRIDVYNLRGQKVTSMHGASQSKDGDYQYKWNGCDAKGQRVGSGIYLLRLFVNDKAISSTRICRY